MTAWAGNARLMAEELQAKSGLPVICAVMAGPTVGVEFRVLEAEGKKPWRKAFALEPQHATPLAFLAMLDGWRKEMRTRIGVGKVPGTLLGAVIAEHGLGAVRQALESKGMVH